MGPNNILYNKQFREINKAIIIYLCLPHDILDHVELKSMVFNYVCHITTTTTA